MSSSTHSSGTRLRVETTNDDDATSVVLHGEVDITNIDQLDAALTQIQLDGTETVRLDASDLRFFDTAALHRLALFADEVRRSGRDFHACGATPLLRKVTRVLALDGDLGLA
jgi:anti-anti-sigma factor